MRFILGLVIFLSSFGRSFGCSCIYQGEISVEDLLFNDMIFKGEILSVESVSRSDSSYKWYKARFLVQERVIPTSLRDTVSIYTSYWGSACGLRFNKGETWLIFSNRYHGKYQSSECDHSTQQNIDSKLKYLQNLQIGSRFINEESESIEGPYNIAGRLENGKPIGIWTRVRQKDTLAVFNYAGGERNGMQMLIDEDSYPIKKYFIEFENGEKNGVKKVFNSDKQLISITNYQNGEPDGYHENLHGPYFTQGIHKNGYRVGEWKIFKDGKIHTKEFYVDGQIVERVEFDEKGKIVER